MPGTTSSVESMASNSVHVEARAPAGRRRAKAPYPGRTVTPKGATLEEGARLKERRSCMRSGRYQSSCGDCRLSPIFNRSLDALVLAPGITTKN